MNRWLMIPALCCLVAFAGLLIAFQQATGREPAPLPMASDIDGEQILKTLASEYERSWRQWQNSPTRLFSRAAPRPVPTVVVEASLAPGGKLGGDRLQLATLTVRRGEHSETIPCVIDETAKEVRLFTGGEWMTGDDWLKTAPRVIR